ncbi:MAG: hypothetical protein ABW185_25670 [Sedimenticola sp.]
MNSESESSDSGWAQVLAKGKHSSSNGKLARGDVSNGVYKQREKRKRVSTDGACPKSPQPGFDISIDQFRSMDTDQKLDSIFAFMHDMNISHNRIRNIEKVTDNMADNLRFATGRIKLLEYRSIDQESRNRRLNLIFRGLPESFGEDCGVIVREFLVNNLKLTNDCHIQRAHRLGRRPFSRGRGLGPPPHRPVIVAFRDSCDIERILANANMLKGSHYGISRDYPDEISMARKKLFPKVKMIKAERSNVKVSIQFPAKIVVDVVEDMFPDWQDVLRGSRHVTSSVASSLNEPRHVSTGHPINNQREHVLTPDSGDLAHVSRGHPINNNRENEANYSNNVRNSVFKDNPSPRDGNVTHNSDNMSGTVEMHPPQTASSSTVENLLAENREIPAEPQDRNPNSPNSAPSHVTQAGITQTNMTNDPEN